MTSPSQPYYPTVKNKAPNNNCRVYKPYLMLNLRLMNNDP